jgi:hypothetical protein
LLFSALPLPSRDPIHRQTFDRLSAVAAEERSIKFLLRDDFLHQYGLLHPSRYTQLCEAPTEVPNSPAKASDALVTVEQLTSKESNIKASLVKCSTPTDIMGSSSKTALAPIEEEEEPSQPLGGLADVGIEKTSPTKHDGDDVYEGLSDIIVTSQELFRDDVSKTISPVIEATSLLRQTPAQTSTPHTQAIVTSTPKSGL